MRCGSCSHQIFWYAVTRKEDSESLLFDTLKPNTEFQMLHVNRGRGGKAGKPNPSRRCMKSLGFRKVSATIDGIYYPKGSTISCECSTPHQEETLKLSEAQAGKLLHHIWGSIPEHKFTDFELECIRRAIAACEL